MRGASLAAFGLVAGLGCNEILDNEPRHLALDELEGAAGHGGNGAGGRVEAGALGADASVAGGAGDSAGAAGEGVGGEGGGEDGAADEGVGGSAGTPGTSGAAGVAGVSLADGAGGASSVEGGAGGNAVAEGGAGRADASGGGGGSKEGGPADSSTSDGGDANPCNSPTAACASGTEQMSTEACGNCGTRKRTRTCSAVCAWGDWRNDACGGEGCQPNTTNSRSVSCAECGGTKTQVRTCGSACTWGEWKDSSSCDIYCCAQVVYCNTKAGGAASDYPGRGTWCEQLKTSCSHDEALQSCHDHIDVKCSGVIVSTFQMDYL